MLKNFSYYSLLIIFSVSLFAQDPPTYLSAVEGDEEVTLYWEMPGVQISEGETCASPIQGGTITDGFTETFNGSTATFENDYVNGFSANGPDVVYEFFVDGNLDVNFSLWGNTWDTYLIIFVSNCETKVAFEQTGFPALMPPQTQTPQLPNAPQQAFVPLPESNEKIAENNEHHDYQINDVMINDENEKLANLESIA